MKRTAFKRRGKPMRQRSAKRRAHFTLPEDQARLDWLHEQRCAAPGHENCQLPVDVHHDTQHRALGTKSGHERGMPMCHPSHMDFHANAGPFQGKLGSEGRPGKVLINWQRSSGFTGPRLRTFCLGARGWNRNLRGHDAF